MEETQRSGKTPVVEINISDDEARKFNSLSETERSKYIYAYLVENHLNDVFKLNDGITAIVDKKDFDKFTHTKYVPKLSIAYNFKEVIEKANFEDKADNIDHPKFNSFRYYTAHFKIGEDTYSGIVNVGFGKFDKRYHIYDINQIKEDGSINARPKSADQGVSPSSSNTIISQNPEKSTHEVKKSKKSLTPNIFPLLKAEIWKRRREWLTRRLPNL